MKNSQEKTPSESVMKGGINNAKMWAEIIREANMISMVKDVSKLVAGLQTLPENSPTRQTLNKLFEERMKSQTPNQTRVVSSRIAEVLSKENLI